MPLKPSQLPAVLERGLAPVYLLAGVEPLLVQECREQVFAAARRQGFLERELLQVDRAFDWRRLAEAGATPSLFATRKIIDLRMPTGKPGRDGAKALTEWAGEPDPDLLLVVSCDRWDRKSGRSKWVGDLDKQGVRVEIWRVKPEDLPGWIRGRMQQAGLNPDTEAVMVLAQRLEGNLLAAKQEIEKLALLKGNGAVSVNDVLQSVADSSLFDAFVLVEKLLAGDLGGSLRVASGLHRTGVPMQLITGALNRDLHQLEAFKAGIAAGNSEDALFRRLNVWRARQGPYRKAAARLSSRSLYDAFRRLSLIDRQSKGMAHGDAWHSLDHLVCFLCNRNHSAPAP